jgi:hypothetical protein
LLLDVGLLPELLDPVFGFDGVAGVTVDVGPDVEVVSGRV